MEAIRYILYFTLFILNMQLVTSSSETEDCPEAKKCSEDGGVLLPAWKPVDGLETWEKVLRAAVYLLCLGYLFVGVSVIADIFMESIEVITSKTYTKTYPSGKTYEIKVWNETVANLTLMALGSSAPEILLATIEIVGNDFNAGELGPGTTVGSAAFNLLVISAVCVAAIPDGNVKKINNFPVFLCTSIWSLFAYIWLYLMISVISKEIIDIWEGALTLAFFLIFIINAYFIHIYGHHLVCFSEKKLLGARGVNENGHSISMKNIEEGNIAFDNMSSTARLHTDSDSSRRSSKHLEPRSHKDARAEIMNILNRNRRQYANNRIAFKEKSTEAITSFLMEGRGKAYYRKHKADIELKKREYEALVEHMVQSMQSVDKLASERNVIFADPLTVKFPESIGVAKVIVCREGPYTYTTTRMKYRTVDGKAISNRTAELKVDDTADYIHTEGILTFTPKETAKAVYVEICDDAEYEEDEDFYLELWDLEEIPCRDVSYKPPMMKERRIQCTILDDDHFGVFEFREPELEVSEGSGVAVVKILRLKGCQGHIRVMFDIVSGSATEMQDFISPARKFVDFGDRQLETELEIELLNNLEIEKEVTKSFVIRLHSLHLLSSNDNLTEQAKPYIGKCNQCCVNITASG